MRHYRHCLFLHSFPPFLVTLAHRCSPVKKSVVVRISRRRLSSLARTHTVARWNFFKVCSSVHSEILAGDNTKFLRHPLPLFFHPKEEGKGRKTLPSLDVERAWEERRRKTGEFPPLAPPQPASWQPRFQKGGGGSCRERVEGCLLGVPPPPPLLSGRPWNTLKKAPHGLSHPLLRGAPPFHRPLSLSARRRRWMASASATLTERERGAKESLETSEAPSRPLPVEA